ncbi:uncharacterized serine-rich protein C215.13 [Eucalyptus grandis]|uniref:uncharacterized serine-rich protein C215.13 n=1 Tax=Eucalyptus grandis TaxID=71139 RepID=UPI00192ED95B|nr:uncharacterized serine-rich protein C215.13 [Eucalyptus grandis]
MFCLFTFNAESKKLSTERHAPFFTTGISPFTRSGCQSSGSLDGPVQHPFGELSSPFSTNSIVIAAATAASGTSSLSNPFSGPPVMLASMMPVHNSSTAQFGTPFPSPQSKSISRTALSNNMFCSRPLFSKSPASSGSCSRSLFSESPASGGSSIFLHNNHFSHPPAYSFSTPPVSNSIAGCAALPEPAAMHNVFNFSNATSTCKSQPNPFWNSPFKSSTEGDGEKISNPAFPFGRQPSSSEKTTVSDYAPTLAPEDQMNGGGLQRYMSVSTMPSNKDRSHEELRWERHASKESKQESSFEGFAPSAAPAISKLFAPSTATKPSVSSSFIAPFSQPSWFTPSAVKLAFQFSMASSGGPSSNTTYSVTNPNLGGGSICQCNASTKPPAFSFPYTAAAITNSHFGPSRNSAPGSESTNVATDSGTKKTSDDFIPPTPFGRPSTLSTQKTRSSKFPFKSKLEGDGRKMRPNPTICSSFRQIEASTYAPMPAPTVCPHTKSTSASAAPDNKHKDPEELRCQCHKSKEKVGEQVDPVSVMASYDPHSFYPVMMLPVIPTFTHSFGAVPWDMISGPHTSFYGQTLLGRNVPVLLVPSNSMGLKCFPTTVSGGNYFPSFNI